MIIFKKVTKSNLKKIIEKKKMPSSSFLSVLFRETLNLYVLMIWNPILLSSVLHSEVSFRACNVFWEESSH